MSDSTNLFTSDAEGVTRRATADEILDAARTILARRVRKGAPLSNPRATRDYLRLRLAVQDHEIFAILFLDNRPSGVAEPSQADEIITNRIRDALALVDVRVLDHPVVTGDAIVSLAERGLL